MFILEKRGSTEGCQESPGLDNEEVLGKLEAKKTLILKIISNVVAEHELKTAVLTQSYNGQ